MIYISNKENNGVYFRKVFNVQKKTEAKLCITCLGIYKAYLNGKELDKQVFLPGRTSYSHRVQYQLYDVELIEGKNVIAVEAAKGWYNKTPKLYVRLTENENIITETDQSWKTSNNGPLRFNDMKLGELYDARIENPEWKEADFDDSEWLTPESIDYEGQFIETEGEAIREQEVFEPAEILKQNDGSIVLDFSQNIAGYMEFKVNGTAGTQVDMVYGEVLDKDGQFTQENLTFVRSKKTGKYPQTVTYILKDGPQSYKPKASVHGFRYVKLVNWPEEVRKENFKAIAVYSDLKQTGYFHCSDELINRLVSNCRWSMKGNYLDVPTDCPTRERAGWTGDAMVYCVPAAYQMDTYKFTKKWLKDVILEQNENGSIKNIVPDGGMPIFMDGAAGWSDAIVKIPYELYRFYGEKEILEIAYPAIQKHIAFMEKRAQKRKVWHLGKGEHYKYIIDTGFHWGEWLEPGSSMPVGALKGFTVPDSEVATAYFAYSCQKASEIAEILNKPEDAHYYHQLNENIKEAYRKEFLSDGLPHSNRQCRYVRPLALDLAKKEDRNKIAEKLNEMIIANNYKIGTGFLSTPHVCKVLSDYGYTQTAYRLLENKEQPGWLFEVLNGATTIWENWYGINSEGKKINSWNHYSPGSIIAWLYNSVAGIEALEPGFKKIRIAPKVGGSVNHVECNYLSKAGQIRVEWNRNGNDFTLKTSVPTDALIVLPDGTETEVKKGEYSFTCKI